MDSSHLLPNPCLIIVLLNVMELFNFLCWYIVLHNPRGKKHTEAEICTGSGKLCLQLNRISCFKLAIHLSVIE